MLIFMAVSDILVVLVALFFLAGVGFTIIGVVFFILRRNNKNIAIWQQVSGEIGLPMPNPRKLEMKGVYDSCEVRIAVGARRSGGEDSSTEFFTYCTTSFLNPLRLLLKIESSGGFLSKALSSNQIKIGNESFDRMYGVSCYDPDVLRTLIFSDLPSNKTQNLLGDLMLAGNAIGIVKITDHQIYLENAGQTGDPQVLKHMIATAAYLSQRFNTARRILPHSDWEKGLLASWNSLALENGLVLHSESFSLGGNFGNFPVTVNLETGAGKWQTVLSLKFPQSLMVGLRIMPENSIHKAFTWLGAQDIETGIASFDDAFIVKAKNAVVAKHKLQPDLCGQLVGLCKDASGFIVDDEQIALTIDRVLGEQRVLKSYLAAMESTAKMLLR